MQIAVTPAEMTTVLPIHWAMGTVSKSSRGTRSTARCGEEVRRIRDRVSGRTERGEEHPVDGKSTAAQTPATAR